MDELEAISNKRRFGSTRIQSGGISGYFDF